VELRQDFSIPWRNLGIAEFNILHDSAAADRMYANAFAAAPSDARLLYEWDQLRKRVNLASPSERLNTLQKHPALVALRDDLSVEFITLLNQNGRCLEALSHLAARRFSPWEGGEGIASAQYVHAHKALGRIALDHGEAAEALDHFQAARHYPENLGEGKHLLTIERDLDYFSGLATAELDNTALAERYWQAAAAPLPELGYHSFFQALAIKSLGKVNEAVAILSNLAEFARRRMHTEPTIDYFATSLPNLLIFDDDLGKRNRIECNFLLALAQYGLGDAKDAAKNLELVLTEDPNQLSAAEIARWIESGALLSNSGAVESKS
jgi:tetratricopeptide (TPR) repeat protein